jgi:cyclase
MATLASCRPIARTRVLPAIVVLLLAVAGGTAQRPRSRIPPTGASRNVRDNLYVIPGAGGNTTVFVTQHGVVLVDTKLPNNGEAILNQVRGVTDKPVAMIINTHSHPDHHIGSNEYFPASVDVVAHENTRKSMEYGGTPYSRAVINVSVAFQELGKR